MKRHSQSPIVLLGVEKSVEISLPHGRGASDRTSPPGWTSDPTRLLAEQFARAYEYFDQDLFGNRLPPCVVVPQRNRGMAGYFAPKRYITRDGSRTIHEIGLNPDLFHVLGLIGLYAVLVHEQVHALQFEYGYPPSGRYHDSQFASFMARVGLQTSHTGAPGGRRTGVRMSHYIEENGPFARASAALIAKGGDIFVLDSWAVQRTTRPNEESPRESKPASKAPFTCLACSLSGERTHAS
jgi:hypothetical protein